MNEAQRHSLSETLHSTLSFPLPEQSLRTKTFTSFSLCHAVPDVGLQIHPWFGGSKENGLWGSVEKFC